MEVKQFKLTPPKSPPKYEKEWAEQEKLFLWAIGRAPQRRVVKTKYGRKEFWTDAIPAVCQDPRILMLNGSMNGLKSTPAAIAMAKMCGLRPGYPDTFLPVIGYAGCPGCFVEIKRKHKNWVTNNWHCCASDDQIWWRDRLLEQGYEVRLAHGHEEAIEIYEAYLEMTK